MVDFLCVLHLAAFLGLQAALYIRGPVANPAGDQTRFKVRLAQRIWKSFVSRLRRKHVWICLDFSGFEALIRFHVFVTILEELQLVKVDHGDVIL